MIKNKISNRDEVSLCETEKEIDNLNPKQVGTYNNIPIEILNPSSDAYVSILHTLVNYECRFSMHSFLINLSLQIWHLFSKKENPFKEKNYRPMSVFPVIPKVFKRLMQKQLFYSFMELFLYTFFVIERVLLHNTSWFP